MLLLLEHCRVDNNERIGLYRQEDDDNQQSRNPCQRHSRAFQDSHLADVAVVVVVVLGGNVGCVPSRRLFLSLWSSWWSLSLL